MMNRRRFLAATGASLAGAGLMSRPNEVFAAGEPSHALAATLKRLETESGGRLGVAMLDTATGAQIGQRADERFPMCSTFKALAVGAVLKRVDAGKENLARRIRFGKSDLVAYSPATEGRVGGSGMSVAELCEAAVTRSDNTAANLLLASLGGPAKVTAFVRALGDQVTRLDRIEPALNEGKDGDPRDTTTPNAMASDFRSLVTGHALSSGSRDQLIAWLVGNKTGDTRLRAGLPAGWRVGDKTGSGSHGTSNDVAVIWPSRHAPIIVSVYLTGAKVTPDQQYATIAAVGRSIAATIEP
ncbi:MAG: Beta-lactamase [Tardiphaga sp.]|nr:Beta-lactamase [Tardiphaga sp.]